jgi:hypothetical protein
MAASQSWKPAMRQTLWHLSMDDCLLPCFPNNSPKPTPTARGQGSHALVGVKHASVPHLSPHQAATASWYGPLKRRAGSTGRGVCLGILPHLPPAATPPNAPSPRAPPAARPSWPCMSARRCAAPAAERTCPRPTSNIATSFLLCLSVVATGASRGPRHPGHALPSNDSDAAGQWPGLR